MNKYVKSKFNYFKVFYLIKMNFSRYNSQPNDVKKTNSLFLSRKLVMIDKVIK